MYEVEDNAVPEIGVREDAEVENDWKKKKKVRIFLSYLCLTCSQKLDAHKNCLLPNDFESHT